MLHSFSLRIPGAGIGSLTCSVSYIWAIPKLVYSANQQYLQSIQTLFPFLICSLISSKKEKNQETWLLNSSRINIFAVISGGSPIFTLVFFQLTSHKASITFILSLLQMLRWLPNALGSRIQNPSKAKEVLPDPIISDPLSLRAAVACSQFFQLVRFPFRPQSLCS